MCSSDLDGHGARVARNLVGNYITSLEMQGFSVTVCRLSGTLAQLWDAPVDPRRGPPFLERPHRAVGVSRAREVAGSSGPWRSWSRLECGIKISSLSGRTVRCATSIDTSSERRKDRTDRH